MENHIMGVSKFRTKDFPHFSNLQDQSEEEEEEDDDDDAHSCDFHFHPFRPLGASQSHSHPSTLKNCTLMDRIDSVEVTREKVGTFYNGALISEIDRTMKKVSDNLLHAMEGLSARLCQVESKTRQLENSVDDLKHSADCNHARTDGKLRQIENILRKVQDGVQYLIEKQEIAEIQLQLSKLQCSKGNSQSKDQRSAARTDSVQQASLSASQQSHEPLPISGALPLAHSTFSLNASSTLSYQNFPPAVASQLPGQLPDNHVLSPQYTSYYPSAEQTSEITVEQYHLPPSHQSFPPPSAPHHPLLTAPQLPHVSQSSQLHSPLVAVTPQSCFFSSHHPEETPYNPSSSYPQSIPQSSSQLTGWAPTQDYYVGSTQPMHAQLLRSSNPEFLIDHTPGPANFSEMHPNSGTTSRYGSSATLPSVSVGESNYTRLPKAQILPHALPTASSVDDGLGSGGTGKSVPMDDVVEKVTAMGFRRDHVRATARKLMENGQSVDLNVMLGKLTNNWSVQPEKSLSGR